MSDLAKRMRVALLVFAALGGAGLLWAEQGAEGLQLSADFGREAGKIRPALHSSGFGPTICSQTEQDLADIKAMGFDYARTHDWALINPNQRVCDYFHIFPLMRLDATDPKNYVFGPTDYLLKRTREEAGLKVFYRLGTSIEHSGFKVHFNSLIPDDYGKIAEIFAGTVRHYNRGWADGYKWGIRYWEVWNEPDGHNNMWCLPEGDGQQAEWPKSDPKRQELFVKFFVTVLRRLKDEFGDEIRVGGPALCDYREHYFRALLEACKKSGVAPDFLSWHGYANNPGEFVDEADRARRLCDSFGFTKCELIINEWHYFGHGDYGWGDLQRCSDPKVKARIWTGPRSHNGIRSASFTLAALSNMQRSKLDQAYYYGCRHTGSWGFKDEYQAKYKVFYALKLFGDIVRDYDAYCVSEAGAQYTIFAVTGKGGRKGLLVVDYGEERKDITVRIAGVATDAKVSCTVLDHARDLVADGAEFKDGILTLKKADANSAAYFVEFNERAR